MKESMLYRRLISDENIYRAIYSLESYIFEKNLLSKEDLKCFYRLKDKFNISEIEIVINEVRDVISEIILGDDLFNIEVYLRFKSKSENDDINFRPIHTSTLINQIAMVSMLNLIVYDYITEDGTKLSNISRLIPNNFYGNIPSSNPEYLFCKWQDMFKKYSSDINETYSEYYNNQKYKYEVSLDLQNFFPSINPLVIYKYIISKLPMYIYAKDLELIKVLIFKLLYFNVSNVNGIRQHYYNNVECNDNYSVGLPQGLPHSYFFGNICMINISNIFNEEFEGKSYYYVDDSVIFTNDLDKCDLDNNFREKLKTINKKIEDITLIESNELDSLAFISEKLIKEIKEFQKKCNYSIKIHTEKKSQYTEIKKENNGERYLNILNREASMGSTHIKSILDDKDQNILISRLTAFNEIIENELNIISNDSNKESYKKKLVRFRKYFKFRLQLLDFKSKNNQDELVQMLISELDFSKGELISDNKDFNEFTKYYEEDIFMSSFSFIIDNIRDKSKLEQLCKYIKEFESYLLNCDNNIQLYFYKNISTIIEFNEDNYDKYVENKYASLKYYSYKNLPSFKNTSEIEKNKWINKEILKPEYNVENELKELCELIFKREKIYKYFELVDKMSQSIKRMLLNCIFSNLFSVEISDRKIIQKLNNKIINVIEFRILMILRNKNFNQNKFNLLLKNNDLDEIRKLDFSIYEVIDYFFKYIKDPTLIDKLIIMHQFTSDYWKNGSKYLYFYTQHNQEHSTNLISNCIRIINSIGYFQISAKDYFLIFCSCYLHDMSMVLYPDKNKILYEEDIESNVIMSSLREDIINCDNILDIKNLKSILLNVNENLESFYEAKIRFNHGKISSAFIRNNEELKFLESSDREVIAEISESHTYDAKDVYKIKSNAKNSLISKKFDKIILRLSDILDIGEERVSNIFFRNNLKNMSKESRFQWLSHYLISGYFINTEYKIEKNKSQNKSLDSYLKNRSISETIIININVNYNQLTKVEKPCECKKSRIGNVSKDHIEIKIGNEFCAIKEECNFMCKWMHVKNGYMFEEFYALQEYLFNNTDNYFKSNIVVRVHMKNNLIESEHIDIINEHICK